jgi:hypothetical protein
VLNTFLGFLPYYYLLEYILYNALMHSSTTLENKLYEKYIRFYLKRIEKPIDEYFGIK